MSVEKQAKFLEVAKYYEMLKEKLDQTRNELNTVMLDLGLNTYIQDPETTIVYHIVKPNGRFVYYTDLDYIRTAKEGERAGTLSLKKAEEAGFTVVKK